MMVLSLAAAITVQVQGHKIWRTVKMTKSVLLKDEDVIVFLESCEKL